MNFDEIELLERFVDLLKTKKTFEKYAFQTIDFSNIGEEFKKCDFKECLFFGCMFPEGQIERLWKNNYVFPAFDLPFNVYPSRLYDASVLYEKYETGKPETYTETYDYQVYQHFMKYGKEEAPIKIALAQRIHDHGITDALYDFLSGYEEKKVVAIMGGHGIRRDSDAYKKVALLSKKLCELGYLMISGGGPGSMEAAHLGVWFAGKDDDELTNALLLLKRAPDFKHQLWLDVAMEVMYKYPRNKKYESLGIPTWYFGHEPATPFASKIAKYFANSVREDGLLTIAKGGIIFTPGSAGTMQEIFQEATQNHYKIFGYASPMIFYGKDYWENEVPVIPFFKNLITKGKYQNLLLSCFDSDYEIIDELSKFSKI